MIAYNPIPSAYIVLIGAGNMAKNIVELFDLEPKLVYVHDSPLTKKETMFGVPVRQKKYASSIFMYISCVGDPRSKRRLIHMIKNRKAITWLTLVHEKVDYIARSAVAGDGVIVQPSALIYRHAMLGDHVLICSGVNVGHNVEIGAYSTICPRTIIGGNTTIGEGVYIGSGAIIRDGVHIGDGCVIGMGSVVTKNIPENVKAYGNPCRIVEEVEPW